MTFTFQLAKDLSMTVAELQRRMSASEFQMWIAYYNATAEEEERQNKKAQAKSKSKS